MRYQIKIDKAFEEKGKIDLRRLSFLSNSLLHIAEGALQIRLTGVSYSKGRKASYISDAIRIIFSGLHEGSTVLDLECEPFEITLKNIQADLFKQEMYDQLMKATPLSIVTDTFFYALNENAPKDFLDKPLLMELKEFGNIFVSPDESITIINQGSITELSITKSDFAKIEVLERETPEPQNIILSGTIDLLEYSKTRAKIVAENGTVEAFLSEKVSPEEIRNYWGKKVSIYGIANYKPGGNLSFVEIEKVFEPGSGDEYFSFNYDIETAEQQIQRQLKERDYKNRFGEIIGKWPGDESIEELLEMLTK